MKALIILSFLMAMNSVFATSFQQEELDLIDDKTGALFQQYLRTCHKQNMKNQPVYLRNAAREKQAFFTDMTILDLDLASIVKINEITEAIFYGDVDLVHLANLSTEQAKYLYEILEQNYAHFIHVPNEKKGSIVASKYPLSQVAITRITNENHIQQEMLEFVIHGANIYQARIDSNYSSIQIVNSNREDDDKLTSCIILAGFPYVLTILNQQYSPLKSAYEADLLASETFQILPIRNTERSGRDDDGGGYKAEVEFTGKFGGKDGTSWEAGINFEAHDNHGNYFEADIKHNNQGESMLNARAGHED